VAFDGGRAIDNLFYGTNRSGSWVTTSVRQNVTWYSLSLGPLPQELPRAAYYDGYSGLNYGEMAGDGGWSNVLVDGSGDISTFAGRYPDLEMDDADHGHISYYYYVDSQIRYATNASGAWQWEVVVTDPLVLPESYLSIEPDGSVVICYSTQEGIYVARKSGGVWGSKLVAPIGVYGMADLGVMNDGRAVVVYNDWMAAKTYLAVEMGSSFYTREILPHTADGGGPSLVVQGQTAHVLAWDQNTQRVEYVTESLDLAGVEDGVAASVPALRVMPNPVTPSTSIALIPGRAGPISLEIVDVAGRLVRSWSGESSGREVRLHWSDLDGAGRLAAGTYYCRVRGSGTNDAQRIVVLR
jgi:hypothetical protein